MQELDYLLEGNDDDKAVFDELKKEMKVCDNTTEMAI